MVLAPKKKLQIQQTEPVVDWLPSKIKAKIPSLVI
jgi:hypothetical protein